MKSPQWQRKIIPQKSQDLQTNSADNIYGQSSGIISLISANFNYREGMGMLSSHSFPMPLEQAAIY